MSEAKQPAPKHSGGKQKPSQIKQIIMMAGALAVCTGLITWTVMLMRDRIANESMMNTPSSAIDIREQTGLPSEPGAETTVTLTEYSGFKVTSTTTVSTTTGDTTSVSTTVATDATAPPRVTAQSAIFSKVSSTVPAHTTHQIHTQSSTKSGTKTTADDTTATTTVTTLTEPVTVKPESAPEGAQIPFNQLLALYLGAGGTGGEAYYIDAASDSEASVILHGSHAYYAVSASDAFLLSNRLGGTGDSTEHPWQTDSAFRLYQYEGSNRCLYYTSQGNNYQIIGYYDTVSRENVWARLHYYQLGVAWQTEYHIIYSHCADGVSGTQTEVASGTCDTEDLYTISLEFEQALTKELQARSISAGSWAEYTEMKPNELADTNTLWGKAGNYNAGFKVQSGGTYAVVTAQNGTALRAEADGHTIAELPAGAFLSIDVGVLPLGEQSVEVHALVNGTWQTGYVDSSAVLAWYNH